MTMIIKISKSRVIIYEESNKNKSILHVYINSGKLRHQLKLKNENKQVPPLNKSQSKHKEVKLI